MTFRSLNASFENNGRLPLTWSLSEALFFTPQTIKPPTNPPEGGTVFKSLACCVPPWLGKAIKLFSPSPKTVSAFQFFTSEFWQQEEKRLFGNKKWAHKLSWSLEFVMRLNLPTFWQFFKPSYIPMLPRVVKQQKALYPKRDRKDILTLSYLHIIKLTELPTRNMGKENKSKIHKREIHKIQ